MNGKVKWNVNRDAEGIVKDYQGNEYYFNWSTSPLFDFALYNHLAVTFDIKDGIAWNVKSSYSF